MAKPRSNSQFSAIPAKIIFIKSSNLIYLLISSINVTQITHHTDNDNKFAIPFQSTSWFDSKILCETIIHWKNWPNKLVEDRISFWLIEYLEIYRRSRLFVGKLHCTCTKLHESINITQNSHGDEKNQIAYCFSLSCVFCSMPFLVKCH